MLPALPNEQTKNDQPGDAIDGKADDSGANTEHYFIPGH
jgi:hypothetical protein